MAHGEKVFWKQQTSNSRYEQIGNLRLMGLGMGAAGGQAGLLSKGGHGRG